MNKIINIITLITLPIIMLFSYLPAQTANGIPAINKTVVVFFENTDYSSIVGNSSAPYFNSLASSGALFTNSHGIGHPSEPNYLEFYSGSNQGVTDDSCPHTFSTANLGQELISAGFTYGLYAEDLPSIGSTVCSSNGYARKHNPSINFSNISSNTSIPYTLFPTNFTQLPSVTFVVPTQCNSIHDCSIATGDTWLKNNLEAYRVWAMTHNSLLIVTFDENSGTSGNQIYTTFNGQSVKKGSYSENINHYNILRTIEDAYGLTHAGAASTALPITDAWTTSITSTAVTNSPTAAKTNTVAPTNTRTATATTTKTLTPTVTRTLVPSTNTSTGTLQPSNTPTKTLTPSTTVIPTGTASGSLTFPMRLAFVYNWFPESWTQGGVFPYTNYHPVDGYYSSSDTTETTKQISEMQYANIQGGISSWWGQGSPTDSRFQSLLNTAQGTGFKWTIYYEPEGTGNPTSATISNDLTYINTMYAGNSNYLHINGKPVVFVYADSTDGCTMLDRWNTANSGRFYTVLKVFSGYTACANQPSNFHQYSPAVPTDSQGTHSYSISAGFWKVGESPRLVRDLTRFNQNIQSMIASNANFQLISTFNEWGEGTNIEPATEFGTDYLDALHNNGLAVATPTTTIIPQTPSSTAISFTSTPSETATAVPSVTMTPSITFTVTPNITNTIVPTTSVPNTPTITSTPDPFVGWTCSEDSVLRFCYQLK